LTFDDGYRDNLVHALPVLREFGLPATIFVTTAFCSQEQRHPRYPQTCERLHLDWSEVRSLSREPGITIGSHTCTHPFLSRIGDDAAAREIAGSRSRIEAEIGAAVSLFCYPSGDMGSREEALARAAGYRAAVSVAPGLNRHGCSPYALRRTEVTERDGDIEFAMKLQGSFDPMHALLHWRRKRMFSREARMFGQTDEPAEPIRATAASDTQPGSHTDQACATDMTSNSR
jgi:peptidoglycan/xylan/chitin deacetylase (PgdA/CDA1 family)